MTGRRPTGIPLPDEFTLLDDAAGRLLERVRKPAPCHQPDKEEGAVVRDVERYDAREEQVEDEEL
jgi:hypothetical protein